MKMMKKLIAAAGAAAAAGMMQIPAFAESADGAQSSAQGGTMMLLQMVPFVIALILLYLILLRPQQKREKQAQAMRENVRVGDEVCTAGGIVGIVLKVEEEWNDFLCSMPEMPVDGRMVSLCGLDESDIVDELERAQRMNPV